MLEYPMNLLAKLFFVLYIFACPGLAAINCFIGGNSSGGATGTAHSLTHGITLVTDDLLIGVVHTNNVSDTISDNNGTEAWTDVFGEDGQSGTHSYRIFRRVVTEAEGSTFDFTSGGNSLWGLAVIQLRGTDTSTIFDVTPSATTSNNGGQDTTAIGNDITVVANTCGIFIAMIDQSGRVHSGITDSYIERVVEATGGNQDVAIYTKALASGPTSTIAVTIDISTFWDTQHFSILEESGAPPTCTSFIALMGVGCK